VASLSQGRTAAAQCGLFTHKSVPVIFEPPCISVQLLQVLPSVLSLFRNSVLRFHLYINDTVRYRLGNVVVY